MSRTYSRRLISVAASVAVLGAGLTGVAATTGVGTAAAADCKQEVGRVLTGPAGLIKYGVQKKVLQHEVGVGEVVTYQDSVSTENGNPYVYDVWDSPPAELLDVKPTVKVKRFTLLGEILGGGGQLGSLLETINVPDADVKKTGTSWHIRYAGGWAVFPGRSMTAEYTYKLPSNIKAGTELRSGGVDFYTSVPGEIKNPGWSVCTKVRGKNLGEQIGGSMDSNGLGSSDGQLSSAGGLGDIVSGLAG